MIKLTCSIVERDLMIGGKSKSVKDLNTAIMVTKTIARYANIKR